MTGEGLQILTYARHLWPLSSDGSLACHTRSAVTLVFNTCMNMIEAGSGIHLLPGMEHEL